MLQLCVLQKKLINKCEKNFLTRKFEEGKEGGIIVNKEFFNHEMILGLHEICTKILTNPEKHNIQLDHLGDDQSYSRFHRLPYFSVNNTQEVNYIYNTLFSKKELLDQLSFLSGTRCKKEETIVFICKARGEHSTDAWHSDTYCHTAKGFLYLNDISNNNSPFCYLKGSHKNSYLKRQIEKENSQTGFLEIFC